MWDFKALYLSTRAMIQLEDTRTELSQKSIVNKKSVQYIGRFTYPWVAAEFIEETVISLIPLSYTQASRQPVTHHSNQLIS